MKLRHPMRPLTLIGLAVLVAALAGCSDDDGDSGGDGGSDPIYGSAADPAAPAPLRPPAQTSDPPMAFPFPVPTA